MRAKRVRPRFAVGFGRRGSARYRPHKESSSPPGEFHARGDHSGIFALEVERTGRSHWQVWSALHIGGDMQSDPTLHSTQVPSAVPVPHFGVIVSAMQSMSSSHWMHVSNVDVCIGSVSQIGVGAEQSALPVHFTHSFFFGDVAPVSHFGVAAGQSAGTVHPQTLPVMHAWPTGLELHSVPPGEHSSQRFATHAGVPPEHMPQDFVTMQLSVSMPHSLPAQTSLAGVHHVPVWLPPPHSLPPPHDVPGVSGSWVVMS